MLPINGIIDEAHRMALKCWNEEIEKILRTNATPPIKGEITKGKIKSRGITLASQTDFSTGTITTVVLQKGKEIGTIKQQIQVEIK